jgi:pseudouridine-5'-phosphate glycosidase
MQAEARAAELGIKGKELTPYLLQSIQELSDGASLAANVPLVLNNARLGASIAVELANLEKQRT